MRGAGILFVIIGVVILVSWLSIVTAHNVSYNIHCEGHLKRAADANTIELAKSELTTAVSYLEDHGMTQGYTSVIINTPDEDVGFWYKNLKSALAELEKVSPNASQLEKTNILIKLRETLLDHRGGGEVVTQPDGISRFPNNTSLALIGIFALAFLLGGGGLWLRSD